MHSRLMHRRLLSVALIAAAAALSCYSIGCGGDDKPKPTARVTYPDLGIRKGYPKYLEGTIDQYTELRNAQPQVVTGFGLVVNTDPIPNKGIDAGSQQYPTAVREYMIRQMQLKGVGSPNKPGWENLSPTAMLADANNSIVVVQGLIPPGARSGSSMDIQVKAMTGSTIRSLSRGWLYQADLAPNGANPRAPGVAINILAKAEGQVFVNPTLAVDAKLGTDGQRASLREGAILDGGYVAKDRPLILQVRTPQLSLARQIEWRIAKAFQGPEKKIAAAQDEGLVEVFVPEKFHGDWQHFAGVMKYLYLDSSQEFGAKKAQELAEAALQPNAPLEDISYALEALGMVAVPYITPLMSNENDDIAYAAARAAACSGDRAAQNVLVAIAQKTTNRFRVNAIQTLGSLNPSPEVTAKVRGLLDSPDALVRIEAYRMLANPDHKDSSIFTHVVAQGNEKYVLDIVPSKGPPLIYASRSGMPRIAVIGAKPTLAQPLVFSSLDNRLTITSNTKDTNIVTIYYRGNELPRPVTVLSHPDMAEIIARLGGDGPIDADKLDFGYSDVVGMLQSLSSSHKMVAMYQDQPVDVTFVLQQQQMTPNSVDTAPPLPGEQKTAPTPSGATSSVN